MNRYPVKDIEIDDRDAVAEERWTGPYSYLQLSFHEQNKALAINSPLAAGYVPAAWYMLSDRGDIKLFCDAPVVERG